MSRKKVFGKCCVCGIHTKLSFEHVPPEKAFNDRGVFLADLEDHFAQGVDRDPRKMRKVQSQMGMGRYSLCEQCNNDTGSWYGPAYVEWAYQGMYYRHVVPAGGSALSLPFYGYPGRLAKQILCMFGSVCGEGLFAKEPDLTRFVLNRDARGASLTSSGCIAS